MVGRGNFLAVIVANTAQIEGVSHRDSVARTLWWRPRGSARPFDDLASNLLLGRSGRGIEEGGN